jgi:hypothetical protein
VIEEGWFNEFRKIPDVVEELKRRAVPGASYDAVLNALQIFELARATLKGKTPAQASGINMKNDWHLLVKEPTKNEAIKTKSQGKRIVEVIAQ